MVRKEKPLERRGSNMPGRHSKKKKAKDFGIPLLTEIEFLEKIN